jgi:hypothetical protein
MAARSEKDKEAVKKGTERRNKAYKTIGWFYGLLIAVVIVWDVTNRVESSSTMTVASAAKSKTTCESGGFETKTCYVGQGGSELLKSENDVPTGASFCFDSGGLFDAKIENVSGRTWWRFVARRTLPEGMKRVPVKYRFVAGPTCPTEL